MRLKHVAAEDAWSCSRSRERRFREYRNYRDVVRAYITDYRADAAAELEFFRTRRSLMEAIDIATRSTMGNGKRHPHQRRLPSRVLRAAGRRLRAAAQTLRACRSFAALHDVIHDKIATIRGIGPLTTYDVATRIGSKLGLEPELVYLHAGTLVGARALGLDSGDTLEPKALPSAFRLLRPREIEDCLCIYASNLPAAR
jgi:hypothetical protein